MPVRVKLPGSLPTKGRAMDAADIVVVDEPADDLAEVQQALQPEGLFMPGDLEDGIGRGVADRLAVSAYGLRRGGR